MHAALTPAAGERERADAPGVRPSREGPGPAALRLATRIAPRVQRKCACGGEGGAGCTCEDEEHAGAAVQRMPLAEGAAAAKDEPAGSAAFPGPYGVLVDGAAPLAPGQMTVAAFFASLEGRLRWACDLAMASTGRDTRGCPYLDAWLAHYRGKPAAQVERAIRRYTGAPSGTADELADAIVSRARRAAATWAITGSLPDLPDEAGPDGMPPGGAVQARAEGAGRSAGAADPVVVRARLGGGRALDGDVRGRMEAGFGRSFAGVRVHTDPAAGRLAGELRAQAFTVGSDVAFGAGRYRPGTLAGDALIAHELAHTVQQSGGGLTPAAGASRELEAEADAAAAGALGLGDRPSLARRAGLSLQRCKCGGSTENKTDETDLPTGPDQSKDAGTQDAGPPAPPPLPNEPTVKCGDAITPDALVIDHRVDPNTIEKPGDTVKVTVTFACVLTKSGGGGTSQFKGPGGKVFSQKTFAPSDGDLMPSGARLVRTWEGTQPFTDVGTYLQDGDYTHQLDGIKYGIAKGKDLNAKVTNANMTSPVIHVKARGYAGPPGAKQHHHYSAQNVADLAEIIQSEAGTEGGNDAERKAIAWAVRNQMIARNTDSVSAVRGHFGDAHDQPATSATTAVAEEVLKKPMSDDITSGAIKWYSPKRMPAAGGEAKCSSKGGKLDCGGGLEKTTDLDGNEQKRYGPKWIKAMTESTIPGVRAWNLRFYHL